MSNLSHSATLQASLLAALLAFAAPALAADVTVTLDAGDGFVVEDNTSTIERLRVDEATGNISRNGALFVHTTGTDNTFVGAGAGDPSTSGIANAGFGSSALSSNTTGQENSAFGDEALRYNTEGSENSAFGHGALRSNTTGDYNAAFGGYALRFNSTGFRNVAFGHEALRYNTTGYRNTAVGEDALFDNTSGAGNVAVGAGDSFNNTTGATNVAIGRRALENNTTGHRNVAIGVLVGRYATTGNDNLYIANAGQAGDSGVIKIGNPNHTQATIRGIFGNTSASGLTVFVNSSGVLGTATSSLRFKQDVEDMGESSDVLAKLRPVRFHYREKVVGEANAWVPQYALIAEEVAEVAPELVAPDAHGQPYSVRYHVLAPMLLNEFQKQQRTIEGQEHTIEGQRARLGLEAERNEVQEAQIATLLARLGVLESQLGGESTGTDQ